MSGGERGEGAPVLLDGANIINYWDHGSGASVLGTSLGVEGIAEFQTITGTYSAEFGGNGTVINMVSRSGANQLHGSAYDYLRNSAFDARNYFDSLTGPPSFRRNQFGGAVGGPVKKDSTFYFVNYEGLRQALGVTSVTSVPDANAHLGILPTATVTVSPAIAPVLALYPSANGPELGGGIARYIVVGQEPLNEDYLLARLDQKLSEKDSFFARYVRDSGTFVNPFDNAAILGWPETDATGDDFATVEWKRVAANNLINLLRYSYVRTDQNSSVAMDPNTPLNVFPGLQTPGAIISVTGLSGMGPSGTDPFYFVVNRNTLEDQAYWTRGSHDLRVGAYVQREWTVESMPMALGSSWSFPSLTNLLTNKVSTVSGLLAGKGIARRDFSEWHFAMYVQDNWKLHRDLTLNLGVRYEPSTIAIGANKNTPLYTVLNPLTDSGVSLVSTVLAHNPSLKDITPRVGLAYSPFKSGKTAVRSGFGLFYQPITACFYGSSFNTMPPLYVSVSQNGPARIPRQRAVANSVRWSNAPQVKHVEQPPALLFERFSVLYGVEPQHSAGNYFWADWHYCLCRHSRQSSPRVARWESSGSPDRERTV